MAEERSVNVLEITEVEGKQYVVGPWPEKFVATAEWLTTGLNPRTTTWNGDKLKLYLENGNAVYTVGDDFDPQAPDATLHKLYGSEVKAVPGQDPPKVPEKDKEKAAQERADALKKATDLYLPPKDATMNPVAFDSSVGVIPSLFTMSGGSGGYGGSITINPHKWTNEWAVSPMPYTHTHPDPYESLSPLTRAVMGARAPASVRDWNTPVPGSSGANEKLIAQHIMDTPGWWDHAMQRIQNGVYERLRAEIDLGRITPFQEACLNFMGPTTPPSAMASAIGRSDLIREDVPQAPITNWTDFLTDTVAFLSTTANGLKAILDAQGIGNTGRTLHVQDPMGLRGFARLREAKSFSELAPTSMSFNQFLAAIHDTAKELAGRARHLQGRIEPERTAAQAREELQRTADHTATLAEGDTITLKAAGGTVSVYVLEGDDDDSRGHLEWANEDHDGPNLGELLKAKLEEMDDARLRDNLVDYASDRDFPLGGSGQMGGSE